MKPSYQELVDMLRAAAVEAYAEQFDGDPKTDLNISGADFIDWFTQWRKQAGELIARTDAAIRPLDSPTKRNCEIFYYLVLDAKFDPSKCADIINASAEAIEFRLTWHSRSLARLLANMPKVQA